MADEKTSEIYHDDTTVTTKETRVKVYLIFRRIRCAVVVIQAKILE
jgi:hypothetical protein